MIQVTLANGRRFWLDQATVTLKVGDEEFDLVEVRKLTIIDPMLRVADGQARGMPLRGLLVEVTDDLVIELPLPLPDARELGEKLQLGTKITLRPR